CRSGTGRRSRRRGRPLPPRRGVGRQRRRRDARARVDRGRPPRDVLHGCARPGRTANDSAAAATRGARAVTDLVDAPAPAATAAAPARTEPAPIAPPELWTLDALRPARDLEHADALCRGLAARHVENFTTISRVVPAPVRTHLARVYAFCRITDDLG